MNIRTLRIPLLAALTGLAMANSGGALAGNTNTLQVTATITGTCNFSAANNAGGNATLAFGTLDQTLASDATATQTSLSYWCTNGTAVGNITANNGQNSGSCGGSRCLSNGTDYIPYTLTFTDPSGTLGTGKTSPLTVTFDGSIANADYVDAEAGSYSDLVTLTITP
jgi:spore coat protein U-like protein